MASFSLLIITYLCISIYLHIPKYINTNFSIYTTLFVCMFFRDDHLDKSTVPGSGIEKGDEKIARSRRWLSLLRLCLLETLETIVIKSQQHNWLNMSQTRTITDIANLGMEKPGSLSLTQRTTVHKRVLEAGKIVFPQGRAHRLVIQCQMDSHENFNTKNSLIFS